MTDTTDHGTTAADAPAATDELEAARQRVRELEAAQQAEAEAAAAEAAHAAETAQADELTPDVPEEPATADEIADPAQRSVIADELTPDVPEEPATADEIADPAQRSVIAEIFDHLGNLARTLGEHAKEIASLHASKSTGAPVPAASTLAKDRGFALDTERPASMAADESGVEPGFAGPGTGDGPAPG